MNLARSPAGFYITGMIYRFDSPLGPVYYGWGGQICSHIWLQNVGENSGWNADPVSEWFEQYFQENAITLPPLAMPKTPFQAKMRAGLLDIPFGEVRTYGELAKKLATAPRAMGQALGANPLPILIPCHRVVAADGLGGFACGLEWKKKLLNFEHRL
jgi:methylated-DNA-[protein]-cysteine S-methyltransferase